MFTATKVQVATYLLCVCPFSIAFLVFLNSSVSFVVTDLIGLEHGVGDAVGTLGFADELLALVACPLWGILSDRVGVRTVCVLGYSIIAIALVLFVQAKDVYPQLLLGRLCFSLGGAAASTMVTAVLPTMSFVTKPGAPSSSAAAPPAASTANYHGLHASISSELTITPARFHLTPLQEPSLTPSETKEEVQESTSASSRIAGFVGMCAGFGALLALGLFLPLPTRFQNIGMSPGRALQHSYYVVAAVALAVALVCLVGLRRLQGEDNRTWRNLFQFWTKEKGHGWSAKTKVLPLWKHFYTAFALGFQRSDIGLGYLGGFVARASSVGISLFIPLLVNAYFLSSGLCSDDSDNTDIPGGLPDLKRRCPKAYILAAELTGASQLVALLTAPAFGYLSATRLSRYNLPLTLSSCAGIVGYPVLATWFNPDAGDRGSRIAVIISVCLIGISQIGAIVCSLATLSSGIVNADDQGEYWRTATKPPQPQQAQPRTQDVETSSAVLEDTDDDENDNDDDDEEQRTLLRRPDAQSPTNSNPSAARATTPPPPLSDLKGSIAGVYSLYGGAGILLLTKLGGSLFDSLSFGAPFYIMAIFNAILLAVCVGVAFFASPSSSTDKKETHLRNGGEDGRGS